MTTVEEKREAVRLMCRAVAHIANVVSQIHHDLSHLHRNSEEGFLDFVGPLIHERMEDLGNMQNGMDAVSKEDERVTKEAFRLARQFFPIKATP